MSGLVSTIIPVFNRDEMLQEAVESVLCQTYRPIEIIIVDDGSTDLNTPVGIGRLTAQNPEIIRSIRVAHAGPGLARQRGMEIAKGEYIQFLDSDDLLLPRKFELQVAGLRTSPECALSYGKTREYFMGEMPQNIPARRTGERHETLFPAALDGRLWASETPLFRRKEIEKIGPWSALRILEDWEYECRFGALDVKLHYCTHFVSDHRHHKGAREGLKWQSDVEVFKDMLEAYVAVLGHARKAGVLDGTAEIKRFARNLFRLARDAGARGLANDANRLLRLAADIDISRAAEYKVYRWGAGLVGWQRMATWSERFLAR